MNSVVFERYHGNEEEVTVITSESGEAFTGIEAKAFLSCKSIKKLTVGSAVAVIGDWAFAHMQNLEQLILPCREIRFGKKVFLDCEKLYYIGVYGDESNNPGMPYFLASAVRILKKEELCRPGQAGNKLMHKEWIKDYDAQLISFLQSSDEDGFDPVFFGWFKVDDIDDQIPGFLAKKREEKTKLVLQRLAYPLYLEDESKEKLYHYIREHVPFDEKRKEHMAVYEYFCREQSECAKEVKYYQILKDSGCLSKVLIQALLDGVKERTAEVTAFLLREQFAGGQGDNYFSGFDFEI